MIGRQRGDYFQYQTYFVHRLVAMAFIERPEGKNIVNHIDGNPANNSATNLEWCTQQENIIHANATGLCRRSPVRRFLPNGEVQEFVSIQSAHRETGVSAGDICNCCKGNLASAGNSTWEYILTENNDPDEIENEEIDGDNDDDGGQQNEDGVDEGGQQNEDGVDEGGQQDEDDVDDGLEKLFAELDI
jgi:hypothetical protein